MTLGQHGGRGLEASETFPPQKGVLGTSGRNKWAEAMLLKPWADRDSQTPRSARAGGTSRGSGSGRWCILMAFLCPMKVLKEALCKQKTQKRCGSIIQIVGRWLGIIYFSSH